MTNAKQIVRVFEGGRSLYHDQIMATKIEKYAETNHLTIQMISYTVGINNGYAMVVFITNEEQKC